MNAKIQRERTHTVIDLTRPEVRFAVGSVTESVQIARSVRRAMQPDTLDKRDRSPVTVADFSIQAVFAKRLLESFPNDSLVAEEDADDLRGPQGTNVLTKVVEQVGPFIGDPRGKEVCDWIDRGNADPGDRFWTLDPIDGTKGFLRGNHYAVALALVENGQVKLGVLGCPHWSGGEIWQPEGPGGLVVAVRGQGAWWRPLGSVDHPRRLQVSRRSDPSQARVLRSYEAAHTNADRLERLVDLMGVQADPVRMDSQAKYAVLAEGEGDLLLRMLRPDKPNYREKIWDQAAGSIVVEEAGGRISDLRGRALDFTAGRTLANNRGILASNGVLHDVCLNHLAGLDEHPIGSPA